MWLERESAVEVANTRLLDDDARLNRRTWSPACAVCGHLFNALLSIALSEALSEALKRHRDVGNTELVPACALIGRQ